MDPPSSSTSNSPVRYPPSEYPQSVENTSQEPTSTDSSQRRSANSSRSSGRSNIVLFDFGRRQERGRMDLARRQEFNSFIKSNRCVRYYLAWNKCLDEAINNQEDYKIRCFRISKVLRDCVSNM